MTEVIDVPKYKFYFGTYRTRGTGGLEPWELKHVNNINFSESCNTSTVGVPNRPASGAQVFNMAGPVRTIKVDFSRNELEEDISNLDFLFTERNICSDGKTRIGLMALNSHMQVSLDGFLFQIEPIGNDISLMNPKAYRVALNGYSASFDERAPNTINVTLNLVERRRCGNGHY